MLVVICGPPCTGKSTIGAALQSRLGVRHLEMDEIRERILPDSDQRLEHRDIAYRAMHLLAGHLLRDGRSVEVNATYTRQLHRRELAQMWKPLQCPVRLIQCKASPDLVLERFRNRPPGHAALDLTEKKVLELLEGYVYSEAGIVLDTSKPEAASREEVETYISEGGSAVLNEWAAMG